MIDSVGKACIGCGACESECIQKCISFVIDEEGFLFPNIDHSVCVECNRCEKVCPCLAKIEERNIVDSSIFGVRSKKELESEVLDSASAGVFYFLAEYFIKHKGYVYGAIFDEDHYVKHIVATQMADVKRMQNSKYVQSDIRGIYSSIRGVLENNEDAHVLFSGTPCQCYGLKTFLGNAEYKHLLIVDLVCHGVPSPLLLKKYIGYLEHKYKEPTKIFKFRCKNKGWNYKGYMCSYVKFNNRYWPVPADPYMQAYLKGANYRESCYECKYNSSRKASDLTMADFAGIENIAPAFFSRAGCSEVFIHTPQGERFINMIKNKIELIDLSWNQLEGYGASYKQQRQRHKDRDLSYQEIGEISDEEFVKLRLKRYVTVKGLIRFYTPYFIRKIIRKTRNGRAS